MEETDDPTDIPEKLNPKYSSASPGLKGNPAVTGKIFSDDCSYIQRVTNPDVYKMIEKEANFLDGIINIQNLTQKAVLTSKKATCLDSAILLCSCFEELGFHSILVLIEGHAFVGLFLNEKES